ncbi:MAG: LamG domain-containing protein [Armatimonadota bacterium]
MVPISVLILAALSALQPADLGPLGPGADWIRTERLRGTLRHSCNISPFIEDVLTAPRGPSETLALRGPHVFAIQLDRGETASVRITALDGHETFPDSIWAVFSPEGDLSEVGQVVPGRSSAVRIEARKPGIYRLLLNSGPASSNACRVTLRADRWALEATSLGQRIESPLYYHSVRDFKLAGLNLDMLDFEGLRQEFVTDKGLAQWTSAVARWGEHARRFQLRLMVAVDLGGTKWEIQAWEGCRPGLYVKHFDKYPLAPCPLDRQWWEKVVLRRGRAVAELSKRNPFIVGYALDPEMYQCWDYGHYMLSGTCFCDHCVGGFLKAEGKTDKVPNLPKTGAERYEWLKQQGLWQDYDKYLEDETYKIACWVREDLHRINPRFLLCVYVLEIGNWFCRGLSRGLGTPEMPVIDYAEATYCPGWGQGALQDLQKFRDWGASVIYGGALWDQFHQPTDSGGLAAHCYNFCMGAGGYWFWPGQVLHQDAKSVPVHRGVPAFLSDYWHALSLANREVERKMASLDYTSPLETLTPHPVWHPKSKPEDGFERRTVEVLPVRLAAPARLCFSVPRRARRMAIMVQAPGPNNGASVTLKGPDGRTAAEASGELDEPQRLEAVGQAGTWTVEVTSAGLDLREVGLRLEHVPPYVATGAQALLRPIEKPGPLLAWWPLDEGKGEKAGDRSGTPPSHGTISGCKWAQGRLGKCLEFDGQQSCVVVRHNYTLDGLTEFTLSAWGKLRRLPEPGHGATIINKGPEAPVQHFWWWIGYPPSYPLILEMGNEKHQWGTSFTSQPLEWELGRWYHVAAAYKWDGKQAVCRLYRDGKLVGEATKDEELHSGDYDVVVGSYLEAGFHRLNGFLDDVRIYDVALGEEEIERLANPE